MPRYTVELWPDLPGDDRLWTDIEARDAMHAAALGLGHFRAHGIPIAPDGTLQVNGETFIFDAVFAWLAEDPAGRRFAEAEGLVGLDYWP